MTVGLAAALAIAVPALCVFSLFALARGMFTRRHPRERRRHAWLSTVLVSSLAGIGAAQAQSSTPDPIITLPPLHVQAPDTDSCVDVEVGGAKSLSFDCLNRQLHNAAGTHDSKAPDIAAKDVTGTGAPTTVGTFSYTGTAIRMGDAFGKSAIPQRPTPPSFTSVLVAPRVAGAR